MSNKTKLELTWIGKDKRPRLEPRILLEDTALSYCASHRVTENDIFDNILIQGDNLLALKALEQDFAGKVKCVFIDPPYNTGSAFEHYDDGVEHSIWLSLMRDRLQLLHRLLREDGSIWIVIDDNEGHYLKVLCDEVFGRSNFVGSITWQHSVQGKNDAKGLSLHHNYLLVFRKSDLFQRKLLPRRVEHNVNYSNPDNDPKGPWRSGDVRSPNLRENLRFEVITPNGNVIPPPDKGWRWSEETFWAKVSTGEITFVNGETRVLRKIYLCDQEGRVPESIWLGNDVGTTREASKEISTVLPNASVFATPKPERLVAQVMNVASDVGDLVLDSFLGSGTTASVAHKMRRRWVGIELGEHAVTHCVPRLVKVINGQDQVGITASVDWRGGGGFRFYRLAPSLLEEDRWGNWVINRDYNKEMLAEAMCKLEGFKYAPSDTLFWMHGQSTEHDFIYVTTQTLTHEQLQAISAEVGDDRTLLICCSAFRADIAQFPNLTVKKIPSAVLARCEWGRDDYSLNVQTVMGEEPESAPRRESPGGNRARPKGKTKNVQELPLFADAKNGGAK